MTTKSREARQDDAIVLLLEALPSERLEAVLARVAPRRRDLVAPARDNRYCRTCGKRAPLCRSLYSDDHEFNPPPKRSRLEAGSSAWECPCGHHNDPDRLLCDVCQEHRPRGQET